MSTAALAKTLGRLGPRATSRFMPTCSVAAKALVATVTRVRRVAVKTSKKRTEGQTKNFRKHCEVVTRVSVFKERLVKGMGGGEQDARTTIL
jgi:hypothetical protein